MRVNKWTLGLAACGLVSLPALIHAEEKMSSVNTALSSTTISGYVNTSAHWNTGTGNDAVPGFAYNANKQDGFNLDVVKVSIERPLDESQWSAGYKTDLLFGQDANGGGVGLGSQSFGDSSDFALKQAYVALRAPLGTGLDLKMGVFDTIVGYETFDAGNNPNYTRSYGYTIEPTTHTGLLATYQFGEMIGVSLGIANTYGPRINEKAWNHDRAESYKTYMGSVAFSAPKDWGFLGGSTLYAGFIKGLNTGYSSNGARTDHYYLGGAINTPVAGLKFGASYDYAFIDDRGGVEDQYAWAAALYASFQPKDTKFGFHLRAEVAAHSDGVLSPAFGDLGDPDVQDGVIPTQVFALTGTVQYDLWKNVLSRLEVRWDHALSGDKPDGSADVWGKDGGDKRNTFLIAANVIYKF